MITRKEYHNSKKNRSVNANYSDSGTEQDFGSDQLNNRDVPNDAVDKSKRLARKLNWTIFILILMIIVVYLILIYVNP